MFRMLIHPSPRACDLFLELFHGLSCSGSICVGVTLWFGWGGVVSVCRLKPAYGYSSYTRYEAQGTLDISLYVLIIKWLSKGSKQKLPSRYNEYLRTGRSSVRIPAGTRNFLSPEQIEGPHYISFMVK